MRIKYIIDEDFVNYKKPSMFIAFPTCTFKCEKECGVRCCQNSELANTPNIMVSSHSIIKRYLNNPITSAFVFGGLEPFDSFGDLSYLLHLIRNTYNCPDDIVIYTGYNKNEIMRELDIIGSYKNIIIKFGRFVPNQESSFDEILGVKLMSANQYAEKIS